MPSNQLAEKLRNGQVAIGINNMYPAPGIIEGMTKGWDYVWIDGQHGEMSYDSCLHAMQAARGMQIDTLLRVPFHEPGILCQFADLAPSAIMVPMINNAAEAKAIVKALRFPPLGERSYGGRRIIDLYGRDYITEFEMLVVAQIETLEAVANAEEIINTEGVDALFFGPDDMKMRMGLPMSTQLNENDELRAALKTVADACTKAGKFAGCVTPTAESIKMSKQLGYQLVVGGGDIAFLRVAAAEKITMLREALGGDDKVTSAKGGGVY